MDILRPMKTADHWTDIVELYNILSRDWYQDHPDYKKARLIRLDDKTSLSEGYSNDDNTIQITAPHNEIDLVNLDSELQRISEYDDFVDINANQAITSDIIETTSSPWLEWKSALVHEALHEYEKKVIKNTITADGRALHTLYINNNFEYPDRHAEAFYTAIANRAAYFSLSPQALRERIQVRGSR